MDLTKTNFRFSLALPLALLIALCTSANANAGAKIYKSVDSGGRVTFTDVPLLLSPQVIHGSKIANETPEPEVDEVVLGWFGPGDPDHPTGGDFWRGALLAGLRPLLAF